MRRKPGKCFSPTNEEFRKFRVENLETELLQALKLRVESRPKIIIDRTGRAFVVMIADDIEEIRSDAPQRGDCEQRSAVPRCTVRSGFDKSGYGCKAVDDSLVFGPNTAV